ncbi:MAG: hypothetical protein V1743_08305 [Nanoarchaeota archaeon]
MKNKPDLRLQFAFGIIIILLSALFIYVVISFANYAKQGEKPLVDQLVLNFGDIENAGFKTLEGYNVKIEKKTNGSTEEGSRVYTIEVDGEPVGDLGSKVLLFGTEAQSQNIFDYYFKDIINQNPSVSKNVSIGSKGMILKTTIPDQKSYTNFYLIFYKKKAFVILTLNYAKEGDEEKMVSLAKIIEERIDKRKTG